MGGHNALELAVANGGHHGGFQGGWLRAGSLDIRRTRD
jgi:hypothetical protein